MIKFISIYYRRKIYENKKKFKDFIAEWIVVKEKYVKESTILAYKLLIDNHLLKLFGNYDIDDITEKVIQEKVEILLLNGNLVNNNGLSEKSIKDLIILLKMILKVASKFNYCTLKEIKVIYPTKRISKHLEVYSKEEHKKLVGYINNNLDYKNIGIMICLFTGVRIGEICALQWKDIDLKEKTITISKTIQRVYSKEEKSKIIIDTPKTINSNRIIPLTNDLVRILKSMITKLNPNCYVLNNRLKPIEPRTYRKHLKEITEEVGIKSLKFHALRHTFATRCVEATKDYKTISVILGHSNITTTLNLYVHPNNEQKLDCIEKMNKILKK